MKNLSVTLLFAVVCSACASAPEPKPTTDAHNTRTPRELVVEHLRAVEAGDWDRAEAAIADNFTMQVDKMPRWVSIKRPDALDLHKARKQAFPDFRFNEQIEAEAGNSVRIAVYLTGTHTGYLDYPLRSVPKLEATNKPIDLPVEYFTYYIEGDRIAHIFGEIPKGHGPDALKEQLGVD
jgi:hypothetical protein